MTVLSLQELSAPLPPDEAAAAQRAEHIQVLKALRAELLRSFAYSSCYCTACAKSVTERDAALKFAVAELEWLEMQRRAQP